ncbi:MAG: leucine-rich repeat protein [Clostridia bacterium]|nr:leucine-rich repeat protein [Clostridia bacterium]
MAKTEPEQNKDVNTPEEAAKIDRSIRILTVVVAALAAVFLLNMVAQNVIRPSLNYKNGTSAMQTGDYAGAIEYFTAAGDYKDSEDQLNAAKQKYANLLAGKENALSYLSANMPWLAVDADGMFSFDKDSYEEAEQMLPNPGEVIIPDVLDGTLITSIKEKTFLNADTVTTVSIPDGVKEIPDSCFYNCTAMTSVTLPAALVSLSQRAFINCSALLEITLPETVSNIGLRAFNSCHMLGKVTITGDALTKIQPYTFSDCYSLAEITIPASVAEIEENAFLNCISLSKVYFGGSEAEWNAITIGEGNEVLESAEIVFAK